MAKAEREEENKRIFFIRTAEQFYHNRHVSNKEDTTPEGLHKIFVQGEHMLINEEGNGLYNILSQYKL